MPKPWWASVIQWTIWAVFMALFTGWVNRSRTKKRRASQANTMRQPFVMTIIGWLGLLFFGGITIASNTWLKNETTTFGTTAIFTAFVIGALLLILECHRSRHHHDHEGLHYGGLLKRRGYTRWDAIKKITHNPFAKWLILQTEDRATIRISTSLLGLPEFAQHLLASVSPETLSPKAKKLLEEAAAGKVPPSEG